MIKNRFPLFLATVVVCSPVLAQNAEKPPLSENDLLKQIEAITPSKSAPSVLPAAPGATPVALPAGVEVNKTPSGGTIIKLPGDKLTADGSNGPTKTPGAPGEELKPGTKVTEITAMEATFDQKSNIGVFIKDVVVKDPQFNVECDKLTAYLKKEDQAGTAAPVTAAPTAKPVNAPLAKVTPTPAPTAKGSPAPGDPAAPKKKGSGLDKAVAITTSTKRVRITQDTVEADGSITHGIGFADRAEYYSSNGDIFLYGMPDVTKGTNRCIATAPETWMKLTRDGRMSAFGPHITRIISDDDSKKKDATPAPGAASTSTSR